MSTLATVIDDLRPYVLTVLAAPRGLALPVGSVIVHDPTDSPEIGKGDMVFAVGMSPASAAQLLALAAGGGAAAVVVKAKPPVDSALVAAANDHGVALLAVPPGASWAQLVTLVRAALARLPSDTAPISLADVESGDLFGMANAIAALVDAPVTIEDLQSRVIAYSARQEEADEPRIETILGRRVPERILRRLYQEGVFDRLARSPEPIYFQPGETSDMAREAVAIRAGGEVVGWIWAAVSGPLTAEKRRALVDAANLVAVQVTRSRLDADVTRRIRADLTTSLLEGRADALDAAAQLGLGGGGFRVMAVTSRHSDDVNADFVRLRVWDLLAFHLAPTFKAFATTLSAGMAYAVVRCSSNDDLDRERLLQAAATLNERASSTLHVNLVIGIGGRTASVAEIPRSRTEAEHTVRVLRS